LLYVKVKNVITERMTLNKTSCHVVIMKVSC